MSSPVTNVALQTTNRIEPVPGRSAAKRAATSEPTDASETPVRRIGADAPPLTRLSPTAPSPLSQAFVQPTLARIPVVTRERAADTGGWEGPILTSETLREADEKRMLESAGANALLLPYGSFDRSKPPVVLVHGLMTPAILYQMANRLESEGNQVFLLFYKDMKAAVATNGAEMAEQLADLRREHYPEGTPLDIVGHCMGGVVARCALNQLQDPNWLAAEGEASSETPANPRAGFGPVRLRSIDTLWSGFFHEPPEKTDTEGMQKVSNVLGALGIEGLLAMRGTSDVFEHLYDSELEGVDFRNHAIAKPKHSLSFPTVAQLSKDDAFDIARFLADGTVPENIQMRNLCRATAQEARFGKLQSGFEAARAAGKIDLSEPTKQLRAALAEVFEEAMPSFSVLRGPRRDGSRRMRSAIVGHMIAPLDDPTRDDDVVDALVGELGTGGAEQ